MKQILKEGENNRQGVAKPIKVVVSIEEDIDEGCKCYIHRAYVNNIQVKTSKCYDDFGNCLIDFYKFEREVYNEYNVDTRFDMMSVKIDIII